MIDPTWADLIAGILIAIVAWLTGTQIERRRNGPKKPPE